MKYTPAVLLASAGLASALTQTCTGTQVEEDGNYWCGSVSEITYQGFSQSGTYKDVTDMTDSGECVTEDKAYSGVLAPLDEGLSMHLRGPIHLKQFAVYNLANERKRDAVPDPSPHVHARRRGHEHFHEQRKKKRADWVTATIDGQVVSWINNYFGPSTAAAAAATSVEAAAVVDSTEVVTKTTTLTKTLTAAAETSVCVASSAAAESVAAVEEEESSSSTSTSSSAKATSSSGSSSSSTSSSSSSSWERNSYYNAEQGTADNLMFLGNYGGQGSGVWDTVWGNSLSYISADGQEGAAKNHVLDDVLIPSYKEISIFTAEECDSTCGYSRVDEMAYKGFSGANKIFLFEFKMPLDGETGTNGDKPALWALNSRIPRSGQYTSCSCWASGCGEADIFEVMTSGDTRCKSTFHLKNGAGSSDYFDRPTDDFVKVAVVFWEETASVVIKELDADFSFDSGLTQDTVDEWLSTYSSSSTEGTSLFQVAKVA